MPPKKTPGKATAPSSRKKTVSSSSPTKPAIRKGRFFAPARISKASKDIPVRTSSDFDIDEESQEQVEESSRSNKKRVTKPAGVKNQTSKKRGGPSSSVGDEHEQKPAIAEEQEEEKEGAEGKESDAEGKTKRKHGRRSSTPRAKGLFGPLYEKMDKVNMQLDETVKGIIEVELGLDKKREIVVDALQQVQDRIETASDNIKTLVATAEERRAGFAEFQDPLTRYLQSRKPIVKALTEAVKQFDSIPHTVAQGMQAFKQDQDKAQRRYEENVKVNLDAKQLIKDTRRLMQSARVTRR